jgi:hypothetical protein
VREPIVETFAEVDLERGVKLTYTVVNGIAGPPIETPLPQDRSTPLLHCAAGEDVPAGNRVYVGEDGLLHNAPQGQELIGNAVEDIRKGGLCVMDHAGNVRRAEIGGN